MKRSESETHLCRWMRQQGLKQEVVTLAQPYIISQPTNQASQQCYSNTLFANCNGFNTYNAAAQLQTDLLPQSAIWDTYAKIYRYYLIEDIQVEYIPVRQQNSNNGQGIDSVWQVPTFINTFPSVDGATITPQTTMAGVNKALVELSARKYPRIVEGNRRCSFNLGVEENLVSRQDYPMLLTFGDVNVREKYQGPRATTITAIISNALSATMPMGIAMVKMRTRFAGLVRPSSNPVSDPLQDRQVALSSSGIPLRPKKKRTKTVVVSDTSSVEVEEPQQKN